MENASGKTIDLALFLRAFKRFWLLIVILGVSGALIGFAVATWVIKPVYKATALIYALPSGDSRSYDADEEKTAGESKDAAEEKKSAAASANESRRQAPDYELQASLQQVTLVTQLLPDLQALLETKSLRSRINETLKVKLGDEFAGVKGRYTLSAQLKPRTRMVEVSVLCGNRELAPQIINEAAAIFCKEAGDKLDMKNIRVIEEAESASKVSPQPLLYTVGGLLFGLLLGAAIGFLIDYMDKSIRDIKALENDFNLPVLGVLPEVAAGNGAELWAQDTKSTFGEAVRSLRVNVEYLLPETGRAKIFLVSSANKGDGKSSVMSSLAVSIAKIEKRVLLVDVDLRRPRQHRVFKLSNKVGLVDLLVSKKSFEELVHRDVKVPGLDVLSCGTIPVNPTDLLGSRRLEDFLREQSMNYDYIFLDAPPTLGFADPMILGNLADSTIITCNYKSANTDKLRMIIDRLRKSNVRLGGLVINRFQLQNKGDYYYNYQHYYYQYMPDNEQDEAPENDANA